LSLLEDLVQDRPLSYYMLLAYSRLLRLAPERATKVLEGIRRRNQSSPFVVRYQPELETSGFARAMELMALGRVDQGSLELKALGLSTDLERQLLWIKVAFEVASGDFRTSQTMVRERMREWTRIWPLDAWQSAWKIAFPRPYLDIVSREAARTGLDESLVYAIMREESMFDQDAVSNADAHGLMQLIVPTAKLAARELGITANAQVLKQPALNIALGCQVLKKLSERFVEQNLLVIPAYNAGPGRPIRWMKERPDMDLDLWIESIPFPETRTYFKHVLASRAAYTWLYATGATADALRLPIRISN
jgi:soluble lytic murein transglycosylase